jgi:hypothetical protein
VFLTEVAVIKVDGMTGQQASHYSRKRIGSRLYQQVKMVVNQSPGVAGSLSFGKHKFESFEIVIAIVVITKYRATIDAPDDNMVQGTRSVYACFARHGA